MAGRAQIVGDFLYFLRSKSCCRTAATWFVRSALRSIRKSLNSRRLPREMRYEIQCPPEMGEIREVRSTPTPVNCDAPEGGYRVDVSFEPALDDGSPGSIEYLLYLTRGPGVQAPELRDRARNFTEGGDGLVTMAFVLRPNEADGPVCVAVHAVDGVGRVDRSVPARCFEPIQGNFFQGLCSVGFAFRESNEGARTLLVQTLGGVALMLLHRRRLRNRRASRRSPGA